MSTESIQATGGALRAKQAAFLSIGTSTFWKWVADGKLPRGKKIGLRCTVWMRNDLEAWLANAGRVEA